MPVESILGLGFLCIILAYLFSQVRYEQEESENQDNSLNKVKFNLIWTYGTKMLLFIFCLVNCVALAWLIYNGLQVDTVLTTVTTNVTTNTTTVVTNSTLNAKASNIVYSNAMLWTFLLFIFLGFLLIWAIWSVFAWITSSINQKRGKNW